MLYVIRKHFIVTNPPNALDIIWVAEKICVEFKNDTEWEKFGLYLLDTKDNHELTLIHQKHKGNSIDKCKDLLDLWMKRTSEPKWEQVVQALRRVNLDHLATELERAIVLKQPGQEGEKGKHISTF